MNALSWSIYVGFNDYNQSLQFKKLNARKSDISVSVIRDGNLEDLSVFKLLVGDVVMLKTGDQVPTDGKSHGLFIEFRIWLTSKNSFAYAGIVISSNALVCDESSMTGESDPVKKDPKNGPFVLAGTKVRSG